MGVLQATQDVLHGYVLFSRKFSLFKGELPVPMEHVAQAKKMLAKMFIPMEKPLVPHVGAKPQYALPVVLHGCGHFRLARRAPWVRAGLP